MYTASDTDNDFQVDVRPGDEQRGTGSDEPVDYVMRARAYFNGATRHHLRNIIGAPKRGVQYNRRR
jgi:hypothetical protein